MDVFFARSKKKVDSSQKKDLPKGACVSIVHFVAEVVELVDTLS